MIFTAQNVLFYYDFYRAAIRYQRLSDRFDPTLYGYHYHRLDIASMAHPVLNLPFYHASELESVFGVEPEVITHRAINGARKNISCSRRSCAGILNGVGHIRSLSPAGARTV